ncbi:MAG: IclR family transcriptional regulator [Candidatus Caldatribacteriota bacterium]|nr:IclR family transcriptional regulator [Candidatus Caldatribacteriota bacterium]
MNKTNNNKNTFKYPIHSVENTFSLLEVFAKNGLEMGVIELCRKTSLPKGTIHRLLGTLKNLGYIDQNPTNRKYRLTIKILKLGFPVTDNIGISHLIPCTKILSQKFNETVNLAILDGDEILYIYSNGGDNTLKFDLKIGSHQPAYCAALGRVLLSYLPEEEIDRYLQRVELKAYTPFTLTNKDKLKKELKEIRKKGYAFIKEEYMLGVFCVAVPIKNFQGEVCVGMSFSIPTARYNKDKVSLLIDALISKSKKIGGKN